MLGQMPEQPLLLFLDLLDLQEEFLVQLVDLLVGDRLLGKITDVGCEQILGDEMPVFHVDDAVPRILGFYEHFDREHIRKFGQGLLIGRLQVIQSPLNFG